MTALPLIADLIRRTKALAALDLILSPEWQYRYYSFNSKWSPSEEMASMRNGCGDEWWLVFHADGWAALKGLAHEAPAWSSAGRALSAAIRSAMPPALTEFANEPAFCWEDTGFAYYILPPTKHWRRANDDTKFAALDAGEDELLEHLPGSPTDYATFAEYYFETPVPIELVSKVFRHEPITDLMISTLNPDISLDDIARELFEEIGYPHG